MWLVAKHAGNLSAFDIAEPDAPLIVLHISNFSRYLFAVDGLAPIIRRKKSDAHVACT
jgi:hypothetical protein